MHEFPLPVVHLGPNKRPTLPSKSGSNNLNMGFFSRKKFDFCHESPPLCLTTIFCAT
jgi:hypothetical protein